MLDVMLTVHRGICSVDGGLNLTSINILAHPRYKFEGDLCLRSTNKLLWYVLSMLATLVDIQALP